MALGDKIIQGDHIYEENLSGTPSNKYLSPLAYIPEESVSHAETLEISKKYVASCSSEYNLDLPAVANAQNSFIQVRCAPGNTAAVNIIPNGHDTINGESQLSLNALDNVLIFCDGTEWVTIWKQIIGFTGSFSSGMGQTVTVVNGIITGISSVMP